MCVCMFVRLHINVIIILDEYIGTFVTLFLSLPFFLCLVVAAAAFLDLVSYYDDETTYIKTTKRNNKNKFSNKEEEERSMLYTRVLVWCFKLCYYANMLI